jgi:hypothetical protein
MSEDIKTERRISLDEIDQFAFLNELEKELGLPKGFFHRLAEEDDWSFVIKFHALIEAAITHLLVSFFENQSLRSIFSRLELSNFTTGKIAFVKNLDLIDTRSVTFIQKLSEIRNRFVHDVTNVDKNLNGFFDELKPNDLKGYLTALKWGFKTNEDVPVKVGELYDPRELVRTIAVILAEQKLYKMSIWLGGTIVLKEIHFVTVKKKMEVDRRAIDAQLLSLLEKFVADKPQSES